jgi:hypothetical protein
MNETDLRTQLSARLDDALRELTAFAELPVIRRAIEEMTALRLSLTTVPEVTDSMATRVRALTMEATWLVTLETRKTSVVDLGAALGQAAASRRSPR